MKRLITFFGLLMTFLFFGKSQLVQAAGAEFTLQPVQNQDQRKQADNGYFNLKVTPGKTCKVAVLVQNRSKTTSRTILVQPVNATTNDSAQIDYTPAKRQPNASAAVTFTSLFPKPVTVTLKPEEGKVVTFEYIVPKQAFNGQLLGSIYALDQTKAATKAGELTNQFASAIAVVLSEQDQLPQANPTLSQANLAVLQNKPVVSLKLQNNQPRYVPQMTMDVKIVDRASGKTVAKKTTTKGSLAPNSTFNYAVPTGSQPLPSGNYQAKVTIKAPNKTWQLTKDFTVSGTQTAATQQDIFRPGNNNWWLWLIIGVLVIILLGLLVIFWRKNIVK